MCVVAFAVADTRPLRNQMERSRIEHAATTSQATKHELGQYFTPGKIADFMASFFPKQKCGSVRILDPGAGLGILSCALVERITKEKWPVTDTSVDAFEIDEHLVPQLKSNINQAVQELKGVATILNEDFLERAAFEACNGIRPRYTHVIMNPPYGKIRASSKEREAVRTLGFETVNYYTAFLGAAISMTQEGGYIVAIVPRSFCNGLYYKPFRSFMLKRCSVERIHLFGRRDTAFKDEAVLQENVIVMLKKSGVQGDVKVSHSATVDFEDLAVGEFPFDQIVKEDDSEQYINIPYFETHDVGLEKFSSKLTEFGTLGLQVSTGPVVDFRIKAMLCKNPEESAVPLLYPIHFKNNRVCWPVESKRPNAIKLLDDTAKLMFPSGYYVVVKRFSAKEEKRRIVASIVTPNDFKSSLVTFENHLDVFMHDKHGIEEEVAFGLTVWLNTTWLDERFRNFSGHTQVNATDLRNLPFPTMDMLREMGSRLKNASEWSQSQFNEIAKEVLSHD